MAKVKIKLERETMQFYIVIAIIIIILAGIIFLPKLFEKEEKTIDELHRENLEGKLDNGYIYNNASFVEVDGLWYSKVMNVFTGVLYNVPMHFGPRDLENVSVEGNLTAFMELVANTTLTDKPYQTYLTFDPTEEHLQYIGLANGELTQNLVKTFNIGFVAACTTDEVEGCGEVPVITCENTEEPVIFFNDDSPTEVRIEDNCLIIQGEDMEIVRAADRLLLKLYNIME